ncbi:hypothetical protein [Cupriavidus sp. CP313]
MKRLPTVHMVVGLIALVAFLCTGLYMHFSLVHLRGISDVLRLMYRSAHIYLLLVSLLNLMLGCYLTPIERGGARYFQLLGSVAILLAPAFVGVSFGTESTFEDLVRPIIALGIYLAFGGALVHVIVAATARRFRG